ncbi:MAG: secondary thiamine-phosphate synthase enzyme YjbQ [Gammaproteobacteria bacterium]|nr:secondary thiamine-phosphate synthase enzyme YjbQ [Gammaproteobacteria bacterium]
MLHQELITAPTRGRGTLDITAEVQRVVSASNIVRGLCHVFVQHTSASLIICENADPTVRSDLERFMSRLAPDGDPIYQHTLEGADDMPAHVRAILTNMDVTVPVRDGRCALGTWQGIFLYEHRHAAQRRQVVVTVSGG